MKYVFIILGSAVVTFFVSAYILGTYSQKDNSTPSSTVTTTVTATPSPTPTETPVEETPKSDAKYDETLQLSEGLQVTVSAPKAYPKDPAVRMIHSNYKLFTVKVKNTSRTTIPDVSEWFVESEDGEYTATEGTGTPKGKLAPGASLTYVVVFGYDTAESPVFSFMSTPMWEVSKAYTWA